VGVLPSFYLQVIINDTVHPAGPLPRIEDIDGMFLLQNRYLLSPNSPLAELPDPTPQDKNIYKEIFQICKPNGGLLTGVSNQI
jgi:hypothetical protein